MKKYPTPNLPRELQQIINKQKKSWLFSTIVLTFLCALMFICLIPTFFFAIELIVLTLVVFGFSLITTLYFWFVYKYRGERNWIIDYIKSKRLVATSTEAELLRQFDSYWDDDFVLTESIEIITNELSESLLLIDKHHKKFIYQKGKSFSKKYSFADLMEYEIIENGISKLHRFANKQPSGSTAFINSNEICSKTNEKCNQLRLVLRLNDFECPEIIISYIDVFPCEKSSQEFLNMKKNIIFICSTLNSIIEDSTSEAAPSFLSREKTSTESSSKEQLQELMDLLNAGLITQEDYEQKKKQILGL